MSEPAADVGFGHESDGLCFSVRVGTGRRGCVTLVAGTVLGSVDIITLASVFVYGTHVRSKERERKDNKNRAMIQRG